MTSHPARAGCLCLGDTDAQDVVLSMSACLPRLTMRISCVALALNIENELALDPVPPLGFGL